jgi:hypothetical protein
MDGEGQVRSGGKSPGHLHESVRYIAFDRTPTAEVDVPMENST